MPQVTVEQPGDHDAPDAEVLHPAEGVEQP
jgi:hypothetical protein